MKLYHLDLYRLETLGELEDLGLDEMIGSEAVLAIEWANRLPSGCLDVQITIAIQFETDDIRRFKIIVNPDQP